MQRSTKNGQDILTPLIEKLATSFRLLFTSSEDAHGASSVMWAALFCAVTALVALTQKIMASTGVAAACQFDSASSVSSGSSVACVSVGCILVQAAAMLSGSGPTGLRRKLNLYSAMSVFACLSVHYFAIVNGGTATVCVRRLGGLSGDQRPQLPMQYVFWICSMVPLVGALGHLSHMPRRDINRHRIVFLIVLVAGGVATFSEIFYLWLVALAVCCGFHVIMSIHLLGIFNAAFVSSRDENTRSLIMVAGPLSVAVLAFFPGVWLASQFGAVPSSVEQALWPLGDLVAKAALSIILVVGSFHQQQRDIEDMLASLEVQRHYAESTNEAKRVFLRWILHELRVPLQSGTLALEDLQAALHTGKLITLSRARQFVEGAASGRGGSDKGQDDDLAAYQESGDVAAASLAAVGKLLDDFLSLAKIEDGRLQLEPTDVNVRRWLMETATLFANVLRAKRIRLRVVISHNVPSAVFVDGNRMRQVLSNYISNAIKFSLPDSEIIVRVRVVWRTPNVLVTNSNCDSNDDSTPDRNHPEGAFGGTTLPATYADTSLEQSPSSLLEWLIEELVVCSGQLRGGWPSLSLAWELCMCCRRSRFATPDHPRRESVGGANLLGTSSTGIGTDRPILANVYPQHAATISASSGLRKPPRWPLPQSDVDVSGAVKEGAMPLLHIAVDDCGVGIEQAEVPLLFQAYYQINAGAQQKGGGTGLGLAVSKRIAELAGGSVGVQSKAGHGSRFWFEFALGEALGEAGPALSSAPSPVAGASPKKSDVVLFSSGDNGASPATSAACSPVSNASIALAADSEPEAPVAVGSPPELHLPAIFHGSEASSASIIAEQLDITQPVPAAGATLPPAHSTRPPVSPLSLSLTARDNVLPSLAHDESSALMQGRLPEVLPLSPLPPLPLRPVRRVVVVDDVHTNRELLARLLRRNGCEVVFTAEHGQDCLDKLATACSASSAAAVDGTLTPTDALVDAWFVDGNMPVMDGLELMRRLRAGGVCAPVFGVTGNALEEDLAVMRDAGAVAVLTKPCTMARLREVLADVGLCLPGAAKAAPATAATAAASY